MASSHLVAPDPRYYSIMRRGSASGLATVACALSTQTTAACQTGTLGPAIPQIGAIQAIRLKSLSAIVNDINGTGKLTLNWMTLNISIGPAGGTAVRFYPGLFGGQILKSAGSAFHLLEDELLQGEDYPEVGPVSGFPITVTLLADITNSDALAHNATLEIFTMYELYQLQKGQLVTSLE